MTRAGWLFVGVLIAASSVASQVRAETTIETWKVDKKVRIDGLLREWPGGFARLRSSLRGSASSGDPKASGLVGYDEKHVYVALKVTDRKLVRTPALGGGEDHATLHVAFPVGARGYKSHALRLYPGEPGKSAGAAKVGNRVIRAAQVVEAPTDDGFVLEARVPWAALPSARKIRAGMRGALSYTDADAPGRVKAVITTAKGRGGRMPPLPIESERGLTVDLLQAEGLSSRPSKRVVGNVSGGEMLEVVSVYGKYLTIVGFAFRKGEQFYFGDLAVNGAADVRELALHDFTGDGTKEVYVKKRVGSTKEYREIVEVYEVGRDDTPYPMFQTEVAVVTKEGKIENTVKVSRRGRLPVVVVGQGKATGFDAGSYDEPKPAKMDPVIYPWQSVKSRTYGFRGDEFELIEEKAGKPRMEVPSSVESPGPPDGPPAPPPPRPPSADELLDRVYALYRRDRRVGNKKPRFDFVTDVAGDTAPERVLVHENDIVVFGQGFRGGTSYVFSTLGVKEAKDVVSVTARDLTGDGKAEIIVYGLRHTKTSEEFDNVVVDRQIVLVYKASERGIARIFGAETGRAMDGNRIIGRMRFVPAGTGMVLELRPGRAVGWTEKTYPFPEDTQPAGGIEPLLTPWGGVSARRYAFDGTKFGLN